MKIDYNPSQFKIIRVNEQQSRVLFNKQFSDYSGATQISSARMRMNADSVTNEVIEQIKREFGKAFGVQANVSSTNADNLLGDINTTWFKAG